MRVLLIIAGIILIAAGFVLPFITSFMPNSFGSAIEAATDGEARAAELCREGETLDVVQGATTYTQGSGYGRSTQYYCVNGAGVRRDVTGDFVQNMFGDVFNAIPSILPNVGFMLLPFIGVVLLLLGILLSVRVRPQQGITLSMAHAGSPNAQTFTVDKGGKRTVVMMDHGGDFADLMQQVKAKQGSSGGDLTARLQQLDEARAKNLISQEEYERLRKQALEDLL
jgi:uncharacterized membrane protein